MTTYTIRQAAPADVESVADLITGSARWMHARGWDAWPRDGFPVERLMLDIKDQTTWLLEDSGKAIGTLVLDTRPDEEFIAAGLGVAGEPVTRALLVHKMAVDRRRAGIGLGGLLLDWACDRAAQQGRDAVWLNVARRAASLQNWYAWQGFDCMTVVTSTGRPSGSLWTRPARPQPHLAGLVTTLVGTDED
ncbi:GNAT family N-acetyltransferase [Microtetraspora fusca]|uniref:GNAT family N-acetyltransferase n=1 Tax=Microtetraspora fusca TaxID=1997 RepID=A0ABW6VHE0_MICFU